MFLYWSYWKLVQIKTNYDHTLQRDLWQQKYKSITVIETKHMAEPYEQDNLTVKLHSIRLLNILEFVMGRKILRALKVSSLKAHGLFWFSSLHMYLKGIPLKRLLGGGNVPEQMAQAYRSTESLFLSPPGTIIWILVMPLFIANRSVPSADNSGLVLVFLPGA